MGFKELLDLPISSLKSTREPLILGEELSPIRGFQTLADENIRACPVVSKDSNQIIGTLDLRDVCKFFVELHNQQKSPRLEEPLERRPSWLERNGGGSFKSIGENEEEDVSALSIGDAPLEPLDEAPPTGKDASSPSKPKFSSKVLSEIEGHPSIKASDHRLGYLAKMRPFHVFPPTTKIAEIVGPLSHGSHLVGVSGGDKNEVGLSMCITQGMLFNFFAEELQSCEAKCGDIMKSPVATVKNTAKALDAFFLMASKGFSGLAVVDESDGSILQNTSLRDLKMWVKGQQPGHESEAPEMLKDNIEDFLVKLRSTAKEAKTRWPVSVCNPEESVAHVVKMLLHTQYHRVWVIKSSSERQPVGVVSLTDILAKVVALA